MFWKPEYLNIKRVNKRLYRKEKKKKWETYLITSITVRDAVNENNLIASILLKSNHL